jgi:hypothetical protein
MKISGFLVIVVMFCFFATPVFASGVLVDAKGTITLTMPDGKKAPTKTGVELPDGAKISVAKGAAASVMLMDGSIQEIGSGQTYTIGGRGKGATQRTMIQGIALAMNEATATSGGPTVHGMVKMTQLGPGAPKPGLLSLGNALGPQGIFPCETAIEMPGEIPFQWRDGSKIDFSNPVIVVEDNTGKQLVVKKITPTTSRIVINAGEMQITSGNSYVWYLASNEKGKILGKSRRFNFSIISTANKKRLNEDRNKIEALNISSDGKRFLIAQLYFREKMLDTMVKTLLPLWEKDHSDAVKKLLFMGYARMGLTEEAKRFQ